MVVTLRTASPPPVSLVHLGRTVPNGWGLGLRSTARGLLAVHRGRRALPLGADARLTGTVELRLAIGTRSLTRGCGYGRRAHCRSNPTSGGRRGGAQASLASGPDAEPLVSRVRPRGLFGGAVGCATAGLHPPKRRVRGQRPCACAVPCHPVRGLPRPPPWQGPAGGSVVHATVWLLREAELGLGDTRHQTLSGYAGWYLRVYVRGRLLKRESSARWMGGWGCPTVGLGAGRAGARKPSEGGSLLGYLTAGGEAFCCERVGRSSRCAQVLLLPPGVPPTPAPGMLHTRSFPRPRGLEAAHHHRWFFWGASHLCHGDPSHRHTAIRTLPLPRSSEVTYVSLPTRNDFPNGGFTNSSALFAAATNSADQPGNRAGNENPAPKNRRQLEVRIS